MLLDIIPGDILGTGEISASRIDRLIETLIDNAILLGQKIIIAAIVFFVGRLLIGWARKLLDRFLNRRHIEKTVKSFLDSLVNITLKITLFLLIANILGISMTSFAALLAAAGLAIGMAMKDNLSNFAGGVMLLINKPFKVGDRIVAQGMDGVVHAIGILYTVLLTGDNRSIFIPNGPLSTGPIINFSDRKQRRIDITINLNSGADTNKAKETIQKIINSISKIKQDPAPFVGITMLNNMTLDLTLRAWVNTGDYADVNVELNERIYAAFVEQGINRINAMTVKMLKD